VRDTQTFAVSADDTVAVATDDTIVVSTDDKVAAVDTEPVETGNGQTTGGVAVELEGGGVTVETGDVTRQTPSAGRDGDVDEL